MKQTILIFILLALAACGGRGRKKTAEYESEQPPTEGVYVLISGSAVGRFDLRGDDEPDFQTAQDLYFSKELLRALDTTLIRYDYDVAIRNETVTAPQRDTLSVTIYDFYVGGNNEVKAVLSGIFSKTDLIEEHIGVLKPSYAALYFRNGDNLSVVCRLGITLHAEREIRSLGVQFDTTKLRNEELRKYVLNNSTKQ